MSEAVAISPQALDEALTRYARLPTFPCYPVPSFLRYTGEYPETYERLKAMWKENT
jgi:hypothetical protein